jgi:thiamine-monophosphate kinase
LGEFEIIANIRKAAESLQSSGMVSLGIGDDCCLLVQNPEEEIAASTDTVVEGTHFRFSYFSHYQAGAKAMAAALSDLAAMAASPAAALATVVMPYGKGAAEVEELALGLIETGAKFGCPLSGGDLTSGNGPMVITVTVLGTVTKGGAVLRSGAEAGDEIWVTGRPGDAAAVLTFLEAGAEATQAKLPEPSQELRNKCLQPSPRLKEALLLAGIGPPSSMIDISDGLAADLGHLLESSSVGARLFSESFPVSDYSRSMAESRGKSSEHFFLYGGEDYELCLTAPPGLLSGALDPLKETSGCLLSRIGVITGESGKLVLERPGGGLEEIEKKGYDHFAESSSERMTPPQTAGKASEQE